MLAPLKNGELDPDLGERGVKGLRPSELWAPGVRGEEILPVFEPDSSDLRSRLGTVEFRDGMLATTEDGSSKTICKELVGYRRFNVPRGIGTRLKYGLAVMQPG